MARTNPIDSGLKKLASIQDEPSSPEGRKLLSDSLTKGAGLVVEKAVGIIDMFAFGCEEGEFREPSLREEILDEEWTRSFLPKLTAAYDRLMDFPKKDVRAVGKAAILRFFNRTGYYDADPFLRGVSYRQFEPVMGGQVDCAPPIRAESIMGLMRLRHPNRYRLLTTMLWDDCQDARLGAVRAAVYDGTETAEMVLLAKARGGDKGDDFPAPYPDHDGGAAVLGEIFSGLLAMSGNANVPFTARFMSDSNQTGQVRDQAAMALGESRLEAALDVLEGAWDTAIEAEERERLFFAVCLNGTDTAMEILSKWISDASPKAAETYRGILYSIYDPSNPRLEKLLP